MTTVQEQYTEFAKRSQDAAAAVVGAWTRTVQESAVRLPVVTSTAAAHEAIDRAFDFAGTVIEVQRSFAKQFVTSASEATEDVARKTTQAADEAGAVVADVVTGRSTKTAS